MRTYAMTAESTDQDRFIDENIRVERVKIIFEQAGPSMVFSSLAAFILVAVLWSVADHSKLIVWLSIYMVIAVVRFYHVYLYRTTPPEKIDVPLWELRFIWTNIAISITWGVGMWLIMPDDSLAHQAIVFSFLMGMSAGVVATYSAHVKCVTFSILILMTPATIYFAFQNSLPHYVMAFGAVLFVGASLRSARMLTYFLRRSFQLSYDLQKAKEKAEYLARTDALTELHNRRSFYEKGEEEVARSKRYNRPLSLMLLDIDYFKKINDTYGHAFGDEALKEIARTIRQEVRGIDVAGRVGGEEFAIFLPETEMEQAIFMAERLRKQVSRCVVHYKDREITFTTSVGVAKFDEEGDTFSDAIAKSDAALYSAKKGGRNKVVAFTVAHKNLVPGKAQ